MIIISIVVPMFNVEQYLSKCIDSLYDQNLNQEEFEIIFVDDESPDNSLNIAIELTKDKKNVLFISQINKGLGGARNTGILHARGQYILFLDSDDWLLTNGLSQIINIAIKYNLDVLEFGAQGVSCSGKVMYTVKNSSAVYLSGYEYYKKIRYMQSACNKLYKRSFLIDEDIFFLEKIYIEDFEFNTRVFANAKRIKACDKLISQFLQSDDSITRTNSTFKKQKMILDIISVIKRIDELYKRQKNTAETHSFYLERLGFLVSTLFYQMLKNGTTYEVMKEIEKKLRNENIFYVNHKVYDIKKNIFRILFVKNLWIYSGISLFRKV